MNRLAPVVVFVYNRLEHTKKTIFALSKNTLAKSSDLIIYSDYAKNNKDLTLVNNVRNYIINEIDKEDFNSITIIKSEINKGLAESVIHGVTDQIKKYKKVIVIEDDLETSTDFLEFMNDALNYYQNEQQIWSISGYGPPIKIPNNYNEDLYLSYRAGSWGWATWLDRWATINWSIESYSDFFKKIHLRRKFNRGGRDMSGMLKMQFEGLIDSWAIRWCYSQFIQEKYTIYPVLSKVRNNGLDGSGTHSGVISKFDIPNLNEQKVRFSTLKIDRKIVKAFRNIYMSRVRHLFYILYFNFSLFRKVLKLLKYIKKKLKNKGKKL